MVDRRTFIKLSAAWSGSAVLAPIGRAAKPMRILILGGTGLTGPHQVRYALARGHTVTVFNRGKNNTVLPPGVEELIGDRNLHQTDALRGREWDAVIDNPVSLPFWVTDVGEVLRGHTRQYVFISTISVYDTTGQTSVTEQTPVLEYTKGDPLAVTQPELFKDIEHLYGPLKTASEREARKWFGDATTVIRPTLIVGPGDGSFRFGYWPYRIDKGGEILAPGDGNDPVQYIDARDLAEWTIRMVENGTTGTFNAAGPRSRLSMSEMLAGIRGAFPGDREVSFTWVPTAFLTEHKVSAWSDMPVWIPRTDPDSAQSQTDTSKAVRAGLTYRPLAVTAVDTEAWYRGLSAKGQATAVKAAGLSPEREREVLDAWHKGR